jgi:hypothetical protein
MKQITITQTDAGGFEVAVDGGQAQTVKSIDEALMIGADTFGAGTGDQAAGPEQSIGEEPPAGTEPPAENEADYQGMRPKKTPGWDRFMMGPEGK